MTSQFSFDRSYNGGIDVFVTKIASDQVELEEGCTDHQVWVDIVGPSTMATGLRGTRTFYILYGNRCNVDAVGVPITIRGIPKSVDVKVGFAITPSPLPQREQPNNWSQVPIYHETANEKVLPLFVPVISPGSTGVLPITLSTDGAPNFQLEVSANEPYFNSAVELLELFPMASEGVLEFANVILDALGLLPGGSCARKLGSVLFQLYTAAAQEGIESAAGIESLGLSVYHWTQMAGDAVKIALTRCAFGEVPVVATIYELVNVASGVYHTFEACAPFVRRLLSIQVVTSIDPYDKFGSQGAGTAYYLSGAEPLPPRKRSSLPTSSTRRRWI
jgi:hypothetical protein